MTCSLAESLESSILSSLLSKDWLNFSRLFSDFFENEAFPFLKKALMNFDDAMPFRGPSEFSSGDFKYVFTLDGD